MQDREKENKNLSTVVHGEDTPLEYLILPRTSNPERAEKLAKMGYKNAYISPDQLDRETIQQSNPDEQDGSINL